MTGHGGADFHELCRLCASYDANKLDIFSDGGRERKLIDKITSCLSFEVSKDDLYPKSLCFRCIYNLENFYDFRRGCIDARAKLDKAIKQFKHLKDNRLPDLPEITIEHRTVKKKPEFLKSEYVKPELVRPELVRPELVRPELVRPELVRPESVRPELVRPELVRPELVRNELVRPELVRHEHVRPELIRPEHVKSEYEDEDSEPPNPADFLEACLGDSPHTPSSNQPGKLEGRLEDEEGPFPCKICGRLFHSKSSLTIHAKFHQDKTRDTDSSEPYSCYVCEKVFSSKGHLALHSRVHIGETGPPAPPPVRPIPAQIKLYRCDLCNKSYSMAKHLWGHVSTSHKGDPLVTCGLCLRTFSSIANLEDHKRIKHRNEPEGQGERDHENPPKPNDDGPLDLTQRQKAEKKQEYHPRKIQRDSSGSYHSEGNLEMDVDEPNANESLVYSCLLCGLKCDSPPVLSDHLINEHNYYDPIDFESLHKQYRDPEHPENMMEAETVFCCEICFREFNDRASLWLHMLYSHRDEASKACGICLKVCLDNETLHSHVESCHPREKTEQRRYSCQVCARQHDSRKKLVTHARIHKLQDPEGNLVDPETIVVLNSDVYNESLPPQVPNNDGFLASCDICFKVFESEAKLNKHKRSTHKDGMNNSTSNNYHFFFACELCGLSHLSRSERWKHMFTAHNGDPAVTCESKSCSKVFPTSAVKKEHETSHHAAQGEYPNTCEICGKMWKTRVEYWKHMMGVHSESLPFICGVCLKVFCDLQGLVTHVRERHWPLVGGDFCCDICGRPYSKISKMSRHRKIHFAVDAPPELHELLNNTKLDSGENQHFLQNHTTALTCDLCLGPDTKQEFDNIDALGKHRHEAHNVMPCDLCTKYYGRTSHLWKHVNKIHKGHPDITCPVCERTSASRAHLSTHMGKHHRSAGGDAAYSKTDENGVHTCEKCSKIFRKESLVRKHLKHCKGPRPAKLNLPPPVNGVYTCERCPKTFIAQNLLNKHMRSSHVTFKCEICEIKSNTKTDLFNHVVAEHSGHPDVKCAVTGCDKILRCKADLDRHQRDHRSSTQLHICVFCAEIVTSKVKLKMHLKAQHAKEARHLCALCLKAAISFDELRNHIVELHSVIIRRPNVCQVCAKPCSSRSKLMDHVRNHGSEFHPCKICLKIFPSKDELDKHCDNHPISEDEENDEDDEDDEMSLDASSIIDIIGAPQADVESVDSLDAKSIRDIIGAGQDNVKLNRVSESDKEEDAPPTKKLKMSTKISVKNKNETGPEFLHQLGLMPDSEKKKPREIRRVFDDDFTESPCELCDKVWPAKRHLWQHLIRFHKNEAGRCCGVCLKLCSNYTSLSVHLAVHHRKNFDGDGSNMSCKVCGKYHNGRTKLLNHSQIHFGHEERANDMVHRCLICQSVFPLFPSFIEHLQKEHNLATDVKEEAPVIENNTSDSDHKSKKTEKSSKSPFLSCEICSLVFASEIGLTNHKRTHEHSDSFKCGQCGEMYGSADSLKNHKQEKHKGDEFVCAECKSNFKSYEMLIEHNKSCRAKLSKTSDSDSDDEEEESEVETTGVADESESEEKSEANDDSTSTSDEDEEDDEEADDEEADVEEVEEDDDAEEDVDQTEDEEDDDNEDDDNEDDDDEEDVNEEDTAQREELKEIRAIEAYVCDNMEDNMVEVVKIDLSDDIDGAVKAS